MKTLAARMRDARIPLLLAGALVVAGLAATGMVGSARAEGEAFVIPPPVVDEAAKSGSETAVLAGGCFWGVQGVFQHVKGVSRAVSGYSGGDASTAQYQTVGSGRTGHAESVAVTFDPKVISYGEILQIYFSVAHDPTQLNRQGPDTGTQYRSAIFFKDAAQRKVAEAYVAQLGKTGVYPGRGLSSGLPDPESDLSLYRLQRSAEDREPPEALPGPLPRQAGARFRRQKLMSGRAIGPCLTGKGRALFPVGRLTPFRA